MIKTIFATKNATLYETTSSINTGIDEILELTKHVSASGTPGIKNSRMVMQFDTTAISESLSTNGYQITAVGEVPKTTVELIVNSVKLSP